MRLGILAFLIGNLLFQQLAQLPDYYVGLLFFPLLLLALRYQHVFAWLPLLLFVGFGWAWWHADNVLSQRLPVSLMGRDILVSGYIEDLPKSKQQYSQFLFHLNDIQLEGKHLKVSARLRLSWYGKYRPELVPSQTWQLMVRLKPPHGYMNPGGFDYEKYLFQRRIVATGYVRQAKVNRLMEPPAKTSIDAWRYHVVQKLDTVLPRQEHGSLVKALAVGDRQSMSHEQWRVLRETGTAHLMAISGLHISFLAGLVFWLCRWAWSYCGNASLYIPAQKVAAAMAIIAAISYALLAGWAIPTQRALIMVLVVMGSLFYLRHIPVSRVLLLAALLVVLYDPLSILAPGFWLSFAAVAIISFLVSGRFQASHRLLQWGKIQLAITVGLFPLLLVLFQQVSLVSPLANSVAIPVVTLLVVPVVLLATLMLSFFPALSQLLLQLVDFVMDLNWWLLEKLASLPLASWQGASPSAWALVLAIVAVVVLLAPRGWQARYISLVLFLPMFYSGPAALKEGVAAVSLLDVGQGLSAVIRTRQHVLVFDTGARISADFDLADRVVIPYLHQVGISNIDTLLISHSDNDHSGGAETILKRFPVNRLLTTPAHKIKFTRLEHCVAGDKWNWDGVLFEILHPSNHFALSEAYKSSDNNQSCVLKVTAGNHAVLMSADIEKAVESELLNAYGDELRSNVLVIPHHGSRTSSSPEFIKTVKPSLALLPVGFRNRYRLPSQLVMQRYREMGIPVISSAEQGAISLLLGGDNLPTITTYRAQARRYWHYPAEPWSL